MLASNNEYVLLPINEPTFGTPRYISHKLCVMTFTLKYYKTSSKMCAKLSRVLLVLCTLCTNEPARRVTLCATCPLNCKRQSLLPCVWLLTSFPLLLLVVHPVVLPAHSLGSMHALIRPCDRALLHVFAHGHPVSAAHCERSCLKHR